MKVVAIDTETTGFLYPVNVLDSRQPKIIEICVCFFDDEDWIQNENQYFTTFVNPGFQINRTVQNITGINPAELNKAPYWNEIRTMVMKRIENADRVIAHNLFFDLSMVNLEERRVGYVEVNWPLSLYCTNEHSEHFQGKRLKMSELFVHLTGKEFPKKIHRAREDVELLVETYMVMKDMGLAEEN